MAGYIAVNDDFTLTEAGAMVVAKGFPTRDDATAAIGAEGSRAESAAKSYTDTQVTSDRSRLGQLETIGGLAPGDVSDATVANLIGNPASNTSAGLQGRFAERGALGISPREYGAVGDVVLDANGAMVSGTDDSAAMQAALTAALDVGVLNLAGGTYYMGTTPLLATLKWPLAIIGNGTLIWESGNGIQLTQANADHTVTVSGITLLTKAQGMGVGLEIIGSGQNTGSGLQPRTKPRGVIDHVDIRGIRDTGISGWGKGIRLVDIMNFIITKVHIDGYQPTQGDFVSTHGIEMVTETAVAKAVDVTISQSYVYLVQYALDVQGYEGVMVDDCSFIGVGTGYRNDAVDAGAPLASFRGGQIAFKNKGIEWNKIHQGIISDALIYTHSTSGTPDTATGVTLTDSTTNRVTGCTFVSNNGMQTGVLIQGSLSKDNVVECSTHYSGITNPVVISTGATFNKVRALTLRAASQTIINNGGNTNVVEVDDTGWITTGLAITPGTNWTVASYSLRKSRNQAWVRVNLTYAGPDVTTGADGNLGDMQAATIPDGYRPVYSWTLTVSEFATRTWGGFISTAGVLTLSNGLPAQTLTSGKTVTFAGSFMTN